MLEVSACLLGDGVPEMLVLFSDVPVLICTAGVVDEDYRGNLGVVLFNFGKETFQGECITNNITFIKRRLRFRKARHFNGRLIQIKNEEIVLVKGPDECVQGYTFLIFLCAVKKGDRVAQLVCEKICYPDLQEQMVNDANTFNLQRTGQAF